MPSDTYSPRMRVEVVRDGLTKIPTQKVTTPQIAAEIMKMVLGNVPDEHLVVILLDAQNGLIGALSVATGSTDWCPASTRQSLRPAVIERAIRHNAVGVIVGHNHPSGEAKPSTEDLLFFKKLKEACELMEIRLLDCIIIGDGSGSIYSHGSESYDLR